MWSIDIILIVLLMISSCCNGFNQKYASSRFKILYSMNIDSTWYSLNEIEEYARTFGVELRSSVIGPYLKLEAISLEEEKPVGYLTGFVRPLTGVLQLETIQVRNRRQSLSYKSIPSGIEGRGVSFVLGSWALRWAYSSGCKRAELLAVRDDPIMEMVLIRLYQSYGFQLKDTIDENNILGRMIWGAMGTLMEVDIIQFLKEWTPKIKELVIKSSTSRSSKST